MLLFSLTRKGTEVLNKVMVFQFIHSPKKLLLKTDKLKHFPKQEK